MRLQLTLLPAHLSRQLAAIVDKHDDYVRELFHLDRFVTLIGFDPAIAKGASPRAVPRELLADR